MTITSFLFQIFHKVYLQLPCKRSICGILKLIPAFKKKWYKDFRFYGEFESNFENNGSIKLYHHFHTSIENELFWNGFTGWEYHSVKTWIKLCRNANIILDIGSNTGIYSLLAQTNSNAKVYAFEPSDKTYEKLKKNIILNSAIIETHQVALSNTTGMNTFYDYDIPHQYSASLNKSMSENRTNIPSRTYRVQTKRLDEVIEQEGIKSIDLIKLDVEKHEPEVLEGMGNYLQKFKPTFIIEVLNSDIGESLESYFRAINYKYYAIDENKGLSRVCNLCANQYRNFLICQPEVSKFLSLN